MTKKIQLTINEIVSDFEKINRYDERLGVLFSLEKCDEDEIHKFFNFTEKMIEKYIPNYPKHLSEDYENGDEYQKALILYGMLYENFREIFGKLI